MDVERDEIYDEEAEIDIEKARMDIEGAEMDEEQYEKIMVKMNEFVKRNANGNSCLICREKFKNTGNLKRHVLAFHCMYRLGFKCPFCEEYLKSRNILNSHKCSNENVARNVRTRECAKVKEGPCVNYGLFKDAKYKCLYPNCGKSYTRNEKLKNHMIGKHAQEMRPRLQCLYCDQTCTNKHSLGRHVTLEHSDIEEQPVQQALRRHLATRPIEPIFSESCEKNDENADVFKNKLSKKTMDPAKLDTLIHELSDESKFYVTDDSEDEQDEKDGNQQRTPMVAMPVSVKREIVVHENTYNTPSSSSQQLTVAQNARNLSIQNSSASDSNHANSSTMIGNGNKRKNTEHSCVVDTVDAPRVEEDAENFGKYVSSRLLILPDASKRRRLEFYIQEAVLKFERAEIEKNM